MQRKGVRGDRRGGAVILFEESVVDMGFGLGFFEGYGVWVAIDR